MTLLSATSTLLQNLKNLAAKQVATDYLCIKSKHEHGLKNVVIQDLQMAILLEGEKIFYLNDILLNCNCHLDGISVCQREQISLPQG